MENIEYCLRNTWGLVKMTSIPWSFGTKGVRNEAKAIFQQLMNDRSYWFLSYRGSKVSRYSEGTLQAGVKKWTGENGFEAHCYRWEQCCNYVSPLSADYIIVLNRALSNVSELHAFYWNHPMHLSSWPVALPEKKKKRLVGEVLLFHLLEL